MNTEQADTETERVSILRGKPSPVDRLIVHQVDPARPSPGGIDTCIRGILKYASGSQSIAVVGVDTGGGPSWRRLGQWEKYNFGEGSVYFMPVARLDPADQSRRVPHSVRLVLGVLRYARRLPTHAFIQAHRADVANAVRLISRAPLTYFVHTQESGLTGATSDSFWRRAGSIHSRIENAAISRAESVAVFNPTYGAELNARNPHVHPFPTWFDPDLVSASPNRVDRSIVWVGRMETPKDPVLALNAFKQLLASSDDAWTLNMVGSGTLDSELASAASALDGVTLHGRMSPESVARMLAQSDVFLMTSFPGYEGFPRVLVEAMASGARPIVTKGADTGGLVREGSTGHVAATRDPAEIAQLIAGSGEIDRDRVRDAVAELSAPAVIGRLYSSSESTSAAR